MDFSVPMALVDFIPVILFLFSAILLQRDLYHKMSKGAYALLASGTIMIFSAGALKALWKLLYAAGVCDFERLNAIFFPLQSLGFLLAGISLVALLTVKQGKGTLYSAAAAPAVFSGTMIFVAMTCLGAAAFCGSLAVLAGKKKKGGLSVLYVLSFVMMLAMGYLSSKDFDKASMNWIAEGVNVVGQGLFLLANVLMHRAGLEGWKIND